MSIFLYLYSISPLNRTKEDLISLDEVNPSLAKYINREENNKKFEEKKETGVKMLEEAKSGNIFEELIPKKLNFNEKKVEEIKEESKHNQEIFNSFAMAPDECKKENKPDLQNLINQIKSDSFPCVAKAKRKVSI